VRGSHGATALIDLAMLSVMQLPALRAAYPSIRPGHLRGNRGIRQATPVNGHRSPHGGEQPTNGRGATMHS
jgi:hypothetical protein